MIPSILAILAAHKTMVIAAVAVTALVTYMLPIQDWISPASAVKGGNGGQQQPPDCSSFLSVLNNQVYTNLIAEKARSEEAVVDKDIR